MGACSSKPKTAEFEGAPKVQEAISGDEAAEKSSDAGLGGEVNCKGGELSKAPGNLENAFLQVEKDGLINTPLDMKKQLRSGSDVEGDSLAERQLLKDSHMDVQQSVSEEISGDTFTELHPAHEMTPKVATNASSECTDENKIIFDEHAPVLEETPGPLIPAMEASTEIRGRTALSESGNLFVEDSFCNGFSHFHSHEKDTPPLNKSLTDKSGRCNKEAKITVLQESLSPETKDSEVRMNPFGEPRKNAVILESRGLSPRRAEIETLESKSQKLPKETVEVVESVSKEAVHDNGVIKCFADVGQMVGIEEIKDSVATTREDCQNETEAMAFDLRSKKMPYREVQGVLELDTKKTAHEKGNLREPDAVLEEMNATGDGIGDSNAQPLASVLDDDSNGGSHEESTQMKIVDRPSKTMSNSEDLYSRYKPSLKGLLPLDIEPTTEVASDERLYALEKADFDNNDRLVMVCKVPTQLNSPRNDTNVATEKPRTVIVDDDKVFSTTEQSVDAKVRLALEEKTVARLVHAFEPIGLDFKPILVKEMSVPDIDDVLEKLASEFERQESLAQSRS